MLNPPPAEDEGVSPTIAAFLPLASATVVSVTQCGGFVSTRRVTGADVGFVDPLSIRV